MRIALRFYRFAFLISMGVSLSSATAYAQSADDRASARMLLEQADQKVTQKDFKTAADLFARADALVPAPTIKLSLARAKVELGQLIEAQQILIDVSHSQATKGEPASWASARETAGKEADALTPRFAALEISVEGPPPDKPPAVTVDNEPLKTALLGVQRAINPGTHVVKAQADGFKPTETSVTLREGEKKRLPIKLEATNAVPVAVAPVPVPTPAPAPSTPTPAPTPAPAPAPAVQPAPPAPAPAAPAPAPAPEAKPGGGSALTVVGFTVFALSAVGGGVTGYLAKTATDRIKDKCASNHCPADSQSDADSARSLGNVSTALFAVAGVGLAVGVVGLATAPSAGPTASTAPPKLARNLDLFVGPRSIEIGGRF